MIGDEPAWVWRSITAIGSAVPRLVQTGKRSLEIWFADTERFARQLHEVKHDDYIAMKRDQYQRQQTAM